MWVIDIIRYWVTVQSTLVGRQGLNGPQAI